MMGFGLGGIIGSLVWGLSMLVTMLLPVVIIVGIVYLGLSLWERRKNVSIEECKNAQEMLNVKTGSPLQRWLHNRSRVRP